MTEHLDERLLYDLLDGRLDAAAESAAQAHLLPALHPSRRSVRTSLAICCR